ncbi:MAG TPA: hypothetical protein VFF94_15465, partial [Novosphingobium sp.]|nr:hypothetical protein [Novosphingobium sp.]
MPTGRDGVKLLLLEDDAETIAHVTRILRADGHVVDVARTGPEAIFLATTAAHAVLVLDRMVPGLDGLAT